MRTVRQRGPRLLIRIAISGMVRAHWTDEILDETFGNLTANRPDLPPERLMVTRERMNAAVPGALVSGYETLVEALKLPDPDDRHVLAAAITAGAAAIVTSNLNDFPAETLEQHGIGAKAPDDFVLDQIGLDEGRIRDCVHQIARGRTRPPKTYETVLDALERAGLVGSAAALRDLSDAFRACQRERRWSTTSTEPIIRTHEAPKYPSLQQEFLFGVRIVCLPGMMITYCDVLDAGLPRGLRRSVISVASLALDLGRGEVPVSPGMRIR